MLAPSLQQSGTASGPEGGRIGVMVVDDSAVVRGLVSRWVDEDPMLRTVGRFPNGKMALEGIADCAPDVVLLDIEMPVMDGLTALPELLRRRPGVKVIMASTVTLRNAEISLKALSLGAVDYVPKPETNRGVTTCLDFRRELIAKVKAIGGRGRATARPAPAPAGDATIHRRPARGAEIRLRPFSRLRPRILAIGSSTGGPRVLGELFRQFGAAGAELPILVTQHMPGTFTAILAEHLACASGYEAKEGEDGEVLRHGVIYVAPGGYHMGLRRQGPRGVIHVYDGPEVNYCKPAVDPLFASVAEVYGRSALAVILTGMGQDGARGAVAIADAGGSVIAQDEASSTVWGMPGSAAAAGACAAVLPPTEIINQINRMLREGLS